MIKVVLDEWEGRMYISPSQEAGPCAYPPYSMKVEVSEETLTKWKKVMGEYEVVQNEMMNAWIKAQDSL